jgi:calpain-15
MSEEPEVKNITYADGTVITKKKWPDKEEWGLDNKALAEVKFTMDLSGCENVKFSKEKDANSKKKTFKVKYGQKKKLFTLIKTHPFTMNPKFTRKEIPMTVDEQREIVREEVEKLEEDTKVIEEEMMKLPFEAMEIEDLEKALKKKGFNNFIDPHFPPKDVSIYNSLKMPYPYKKIVQWRRPKDFMKTKPKVFSDEVDPNDIKQGFLGNCWFMCAVACLAERPALVKRLFMTHEYNEEGIYRIRICKNGEWVTVTVDDYIPCYYNAGPMFAHSNGDELWVLLLEKAYAKVHGNYYALKSGFSYHGMLDLTGCPTEHIRFPAEKASYEDVEDEAEEIFEKMLEADESGALISASTPGKDKLTTGTGKKPKTGLVPGHAYSIIQVKEYEDIKLVNIRNPWGRFEWDGDWSDDSDLWTEEMIEAFEPVLDSKDGSFWMSLEDFFMRYKSVTLCDVKNWNEVRLRGKFIKVTGKNDPGQDQVIPKFYYSFDIEEDETEVVISLHQEDKRNLGSQLRSYLDVGFIILKRDEEDEGNLEYFDHSNLERDREVFKRVKFDEGSYVVVPITSGGLLQKISVKASKNEDKAVNTKQLSVKGLAKDWLQVRQYYCSTLYDVFRKIDVAMNGILSADELNTFGRIIGEKKFISIKQADFKTSKFKDMSCTKEGLTKFGFMQFLFKNFKVEEIAMILTKLGYDEQLNSLKSRVFVVTFQADEPLTVKINDILDGNMYKTSINMYLNHLYDSGEVTIEPSSHEDIEIVKYYDSKAKVYLFAAMNNSESR